MRKYVNCRTVPSGSDCTVEISADTEDEVLDIAITHAVRDHHREDTPELRSAFRGAIHSREEALI